MKMARYRSTCSLRFLSSILIVVAAFIATTAQAGNLIAVAQAAPNPATAGQQLTLDGAQSSHQLEGRNIISWEWDLDNDGVFDASGPAVITSFPAVGQYPVTLRVTDDSATPLVDVAELIVDVTVAPLKPTAVAGGPYLFCPQDTPWWLDGSRSVNPDDGLSSPGNAADRITAYAWDLNNDLNFTDGSGAVINATAQLQNLGVGDHVVRLRVTDNSAAAFPGSGQANLSDTSIAQVSVRDQSDLLCNCIPDLAARPKTTKVQLTWTDTGAYQYAVYRSLVSGGPFQQIAVTDSRYSTYLDLGLQLDTTYNYVVSARGSNGKDICRSRQISATPSGRLSPAGNRPPVFSSTPVIQALEGAPYSYDVNATDPDARDMVTFSLGAAPVGMSIDANSGLVQWTPVNAQVGQHAVRVLASDSQGAYVEQSFVITVANVNQGPAIISEPVLTATENVAYRYLVQAIDWDLGDQLTYSLATAPAGMAINTQTGEVAWTPAIGQVGNQAVEVQVADAAGTVALQNFIVVVAGQNLPPSITSTPLVEASPDLEYRYDVEAVDPNSSDALTYALDEFPHGMVIDPVTGLITWTPTLLQVGVHEIAISVLDSAGSVVQQQYSLSVASSQTGISIRFISVPETEIQSGGSYGYTALARANSGSSMEYHLLVAPQGMSLDSQSGSLTWRPANDDLGPNPVLIRAVDAAGNWAEQKFVVNVNESIPTLRILSSPVTTAFERKRYEYQLQVEPVEASKTFSLQSSTGSATVSDTGKIEWTPDPSYVEPLQIRNDSCSIDPLRLGTFDPVLKWHWNGGQVANPPMVAQFNDDNGDGVIDISDNPDVAFIAYQTDSLMNEAWIQVLDGSSGIPLASFVTPTEHFHGYGQLALGDIDNDGYIDIVSTTADGRLVAYDHTGGAPKWTTQLPSSVFIMNHVALYDLNGDGNTEILLGKAVYDANGNLLWEGSGVSRGAAGGYGYCSACTFLHGENYSQTSFAMDILDHHPGLEVIVGNEVYSAAGLLLWSGQMGDGFSAVADLDKDGRAEVVVSGINSLTAYDNAGDVKMNWDFPSVGYGSPPTIADIDGDGELEIGVVTLQYYIVFNHDGTLLWFKDVAESSSGMTGSTVFDFEGDGEADIVYLDEQFLRVYNRHGDEKYKIVNNSHTWTEYPVVVDLDNDAHADILIPSSDRLGVSGANNPTVGVRAFRDARNSWMPTRSIWNQHAYHIDNVEDDGSIPAVPAKSFQTHNTFRLSRLLDRNGVDRIDIALGNLQLINVDGLTSIRITVTNQTGVPVSSTGAVRIYHGHPDAGGALLAEFELPVLAAYQSHTFSQNVATAGWSQDIHAVLQYDGSMTECLTDNNSMRAALFRARVEDASGQSDSQLFLVGVKNLNEPPAFTSAPVTTAIWGRPYLYEATVSDPDAGDAIRYELENAPDGMEIQSASGVIFWNATTEQLGSYEITVKATDAAGLVAYQNFTLTINENSDLNRAPHFTGQTDLFMETGNILFDQVGALDPDGDTISYYLLEGPAGMELHISGNLVWMDSQFMPLGSYPFKVRITDSRGLSRTEDFNLWITQTPVSPDSNPPEQVGVNYKLVFLANAANNVALPTPELANGYVYSIVAGPAGPVLDQNILQWTPLESDIGVHSLLVELSNGSFAYRYSLTIDVRSSENVGPQMNLSGFPATLIANEPFEFRFNPVDPDGDPVTLRIPQLPSTARLEADNLFRWTPTLLDEGQKTLTVIVTDDAGLSATFDIHFAVRAYRNNPPQFIQLEPKNFASIGRFYQYQFLVTDPDNDPVTLELLSGPAGMSLNPAGLLSLPEIPESLRGVYTIQVSANDGNGGTNTASFELRVDFNQPPVVSTYPMSAAYVDELYTYDIRARDPEGYVLTFELITAPEGMIIDGSSGSLSWVPTAQQIGIHPVEVLVVDDLNGAQRHAFDVTVYQGRIMHRNICLPGDQE